MPTTASIQKTIDRILARFTDPKLPELMHYVSGVAEMRDGAIDDEAQYANAERQTPDFVAKDNAGWHSLNG